MVHSLSAGIFGACVLALVGCTATAPNPLRDSLSIDSNMYVVQAGDSIDAIAFRYRLTSSELLALNPNLNQGLYQGQRLRVRSGQRDIAPATREVTRVATATTPQPEPRVVVTAVQPQGPVLREEIIEDPLSPAATQRASGLSVPPARTDNAVLSSAGWRWPSAGEVVRDYSPGEVNGQGIDIAGIPGQNIVAVSDGTVIYAGRDLSNAGNLVIIRHGDDVLSTYSHAKDLYVTEDDVVRGGDPIATLGWNSNRESVLHFGVRKDGKPVNPSQYLPRR